MPEVSVSLTKLPFFLIQVNFHTKKLLRSAIISMLKGEALSFSGGHIVQFDPITPDISSKRRDAFVNFKKTGIN